MALYKDGEVYRTYEQQVNHLTEAHLKQLEQNEIFAENIKDLGISSNLGGYNYVRFAFRKDGQVYYRLNTYQIIINTPIMSDNTTPFASVGDYIQLSYNRVDDIPAYGYCTDVTSDSTKFTSVIRISYLGDFKYIDSTKNGITITNVTRGGLTTVMLVGLSQFFGSSLNDYDPNDRKKQVFNVIYDTSYGTRTQYVSFDLNGDGVYNYVFIGVNNDGKDGYSVMAVNNLDIGYFLNLVKDGDSIIFSEDNTSDFVNPNAKAGDIYKRTASTFTFMGNIKGAKGDKGDKGDTGEQGIQGVQGIQGIQGEKGDKGDKGDAGDQGLLLHDAILSSPSELPDFSSAKIGDAWRVLNTSGSVIVYDLYFKSVDGTTWSLQPNWGGIQGPKGDKGDKGDTGAQGVQGIQGEKGDKGDKGDAGAQGNAGADGKNAIYAIKYINIGSYSNKILNRLSGDIYIPILDESYFTNPPINNGDVFNCVLYMTKDIDSYFGNGTYSVNGYYNCVLKTINWTARVFNILTSSCVTFDNELGNFFKTELKLHTIKLSPESNVLTLVVYDYSSQFPSFININTNLGDILLQNMYIGSPKLYKGSFSITVPVSVPDIPTLKSLTITFSIDPSGLYYRCITKDIDFPNYDKRIGDVYFNYLISDEYEKSITAILSDI